MLDQGGGTMAGSTDRISLAMSKITTVIVEEGSAETKSDDETSSVSSDSLSGTSESGKTIQKESIGERTLSVEGIHEWSTPTEQLLPEVKSEPVEMSEEKAIFTEMNVVSCPENQSKTPLSFRSDFIPDEILQELTNASVKGDRPFYIGPPKLTKTPKDLKIHGIRPADSVWHHTAQRRKLNFLIEQPVSFTSAGRDISFIYDAIAPKYSEKSELPVLQRIVRTQDPSSKQKQVLLPNTLIPEEYHIVKNKGITPLEYYEDKYTTLLQDDEHKLRVFPSMKPNKKFEVLQLSKVMDSMLEKAGINDAKMEMKGETELHHLLELVKQEQNIYNIVFHELIRQITVDCAERGELLSKVRQKYVNLLDSVPRHVKCLHDEILTQRALDRYLVQELFLFKTAIEELSGELSDIREHDLKVTRETEAAQDELAKALLESRKNANLVEEFHVLYELQRRRLDKQIRSLTRERDWWCAAAYSLALKVIEDNRLQLARRLQVSEKSWSKLGEHFAIILSLKDTEDLGVIQKMIEHWRELMSKFTTKLEHFENTSMEKRKLVLSEIRNWQKYFAEKVLAPLLGFQGFSSESIRLLHTDLERWQEMIIQDCERYEGSLLLDNQEALNEMFNQEKEWTELTMAVFARHQKPNAVRFAEEKAMDDINAVINKLFKECETRIMGKNGSLTNLVSFISMLESWQIKFDSAERGSTRLSEFDWIKLFQQFPIWINLMERSLEMPETDNTLSTTLNKLPHIRLRLEEINQSLHIWLRGVIELIENVNANQITEVHNLHTQLTRWMVDMLLHLVPDPIGAISGNHFNNLSSSSILAKLEEEASKAAPKMDAYTTNMYNWCSDIVEAIFKERMVMHDEIPDHELKELEKMKVERTNWIRNCELLLSEVKNSPVQLLPTRSSIEISSNVNPAVDKCGPCVQRLDSLNNLPSREPGNVDITMEVESSEATSGTNLSAQDTRFSELMKAGMPSSVVASMEDPNLEQFLELSERESFEITVTRAETSDVLRNRINEIRELPETSGTTGIGLGHLESALDTVRYIAPDENIQVKNLTDVLVPLIPGGSMVVRPENPKSKQVFQSLATVELLQAQLVEAEKRAQIAEEFKIDLDEQLRSALEQIKTMTLDAESKEEESSSTTPEQSVQTPTLDSLKITKTDIKSSRSKSRAGKLVKQVSKTSKKS